MTKLNQFILLLIVSFLIVSCNDKIDHGRESLEGVWTVNTIIEIENEVQEFGSSTLSQTEIEDPEGSFSFNEETVDYSYLLTYGVQSSVESYTLSVTRQNAGFTKVDVFTLVIGDRSYGIEFGNQTKKSYKDATEIRLTETVIDADREFVTILELSK